VVVAVVLVVFDFVAVVVVAAAAVVVVVAAAAVVGVAVISDGFRRNLSFLCYCIVLSMHRISRILTKYYLF